MVRPVRPSCGPPPTMAVGHEVTGRSLRFGRPRPAGARDRYTGPEPVAWIRA